MDVPLCLLVRVPGRPVAERFARFHVKAIRPGFFFFAAERENASRSNPADTARLPTPHTSLYSAVWRCSSPSAPAHVALSIIFFTMVGAAYYAFIPLSGPCHGISSSESAAAASIGLINSIGNLAVPGPHVMAIL